MSSKIWRNTIVGTAAGLAASATAAMALPYDWQMTFQPAASPVMEQIENFHVELFYIIVAVCLFVAALLIYIMIKFRAGVNPVPSKVHHNTCWKSPGPSSRLSSWW